MHILQPTQTKLSKEDIDKILKKYNISLTQLPKIKITDPTLSEDFDLGDVVKIERKQEGKKIFYYRVVSI